MRKRKWENLVRRVNALEWEIKNLKQVYQNGLTKCELCGKVIIKKYHLKEVI